MQTKQTEIYSETTTSHFLNGYFAIQALQIGVACGVMALIYRFFYCAVWSWLVILCCIIAFALLLLLFTYPKLAISVTSQSVTVKHGILKRVVLWEDIVDCHTEYFSLGYMPFTTSIRVSKGEWKLMYYVHDGHGSQQRVVLKLKRGMIKEFTFFTRDQDVVMDVIKQHIGKQEKQETIA